MASSEFDALIDHLERTRPGVYRFSDAMSGRAPGLRIDRPGVEGFAFVYPPSRSGLVPYLFTLKDLDETFAEPSVEDVEATLRRWAFPTPWTAPAPVDRDTERVRLTRIRDALDRREPAVDLTDALPTDLVDRIDPARLTRHFPSDPAGRLALATRVVLAEPIPAKNKISRTGCLVAVGPARRRDPQRIRVVWEELILANQDHRWDRARWLWTADPVPEDEIALPAGGEEALTDFDAGRIVEGLARFGVGLSPDLQQVLGGVRIRPPACCAHVDPAWSALVAEVVRSCAPWNLPAAVVPSPGKLAIFPGQTHARKAGMALVRGTGGRPEIAIDTTASNVRLAERLWVRPLAMDLRRYGLL